MEVLMGPTFGIDVSAAYVRDLNGGAANDNSSGCALFLLEEEGREAGMDRVGSPEDRSDSMSSIGALGDSSEDGEEDDAVSSMGGLGSFSSLENCLPIKRGLSNHYVGKSKSFANLSEVSSVKDLEKFENPFNKRRRRRVLTASKRRSSSLYSWQSPSSMHLLAVHENDEDGACNNKLDNGDESINHRHHQNPM